MPDVHGEQFRVLSVFYATARVEQGRIGLVEGADTEAVRRATPPVNGIVAAVEGGLVVFTLRERGAVPFRVVLLAEPPGDAAVSAYDDVVELSFHAERGSADVVTLDAGDPVAARAVTFPGSGPVRARVDASGRLDPAAEQYVIELWQAPEAPERVLRNAADVAAARKNGPERAYRWIDASALEEAACLTFVPGATPEQVLDAFRADPADSAAWADRFEAFPDLDPFVAVLGVPGGVVAVEDNRWTGTEPSVLRRASRAGRAASAFWNVNGLGRLCFARDATVLADAEWGIEAVGPDLDPEVADAVAGIDFDDVHAFAAKYVLAASRFTGLTLRRTDLDALAAGRAYRIVPPLPALHPVPRPPRGAEIWRGERFLGPFYLSELAEEFGEHPTHVLTDLAHWAATRAVAAAGLGEHPAVVAALARLADRPGAPLDPDAALLVRRSTLHLDPDHSTEAWEKRHHALTALHQATNPDPLGAVAGALGFAHETLRAGGPDFLDQARRRAADS